MPCQRPWHPDDNGFDTGIEDRFLKRPATTAGIIARTPMIAVPVGQAGWPQHGQFDVAIKRLENADQWNRKRHPLLNVRMNAYFK